jgi:hypothetical protein
LDGKFFFPDDEGKEPLVSCTVSCTKKDYDKLTSSALGGIGGIIGGVFTVLILLNIIISAFASAAYTAAAAYIIVTLFFAAVYFIPLSNVKKLYTLPPYNSACFCYSFYRHHFTLADEYEGLSLSYDDISSASEDSLMFTLTVLNGVYYIIPKRELENKQSEMLHAVLENKLGDKFKAKDF